MTVVKAGLDATPPLGTWGWSVAVVEELLGRASEVLCPAEKSKSSPCPHSAWGKDLVAR